MRIGDWSSDVCSSDLVAGRRRYTAVNAVAREGGAVKPIPCAILDEGDDADALEASMLENLARVRPDEVSQWEAFVALVKTGRSVDEVADTLDRKSTRLNSSH